MEQRMSAMESHAQDGLGCRCADRAADAATESGRLKLHWDSTSVLDLTAALRTGRTKYGCSHRSTILELLLEAGPHSWVERAAVAVRVVAVECAKFANEVESSFQSS
jgi:hypothetical protein